MPVMKITLYSPDNEVKATFSRGFVPWRLLKQAVKLTKNLKGKDATDLEEDDVDALASLVVEAFGNQFSVQDLNDGADIGEMTTVLNTIVQNAAGAIGANPTRPQS